MQRQTQKRNRWTFLSAATMIVMLGSSVGCVSLKHYVRHHSVVATVGDKHKSDYFHCPHCGQIIPTKGFNKCPRCYQIPAYHGYEPTCWRQWPEGWGCPPESVVNNPEFWEQGMVESDQAQPVLMHEIQELPPQQIETLQAPVDTPAPQAEPAPQPEPATPEQVSIAPATEDVAITNRNAIEAPLQDPSPEATTAQQPEATTAQQPQATTAQQPEAITEHQPQAASTQLHAEFAPSNEPVADPVRTPSPVARQANTPTEIAPQKQTVVDDTDAPATQGSDVAAEAEFSIEYEETPLPRAQVVVDPITEASEGASAEEEFVEEQIVNELFQEKRSLAPIEQKSIFEFAPESRNETQPSNKASESILDQSPVESSGPEIVDFPTPSFVPVKRIALPSKIATLEVDDEATTSAKQPVTVIENPSGKQVATSPTTQEPQKAMDTRAATDTMVPSKSPAVLARPAKRPSRASSVLMTSKSTPEFAPVSIRKNRSVLKSTKQETLAPTNVSVEGYAPLPVRRIAPPRNVQTSASVPDSNHPAPVSRIPLSALPLQVAQ